jgi:hypothetical protein
MRTERRQELRTNELSHQLDEVREYVRTNATLLTVIVVGAAVLVGAGFAYIKWQRDRQAEAWAAVDRSDPEASVSKKIEDLDGVVQQNLAPSLTVAALLKTAGMAMKAQTLPAAEQPGDLAAPATAKPDWGAKAREAYTRILKEHADDPIATGQATVGLGVLAEDQGRYAEAREGYNKILNDSRYAALPFAVQAKYRLDLLDIWAKPIVFPKPQMTVQIPQGMETEAFTVPSPDATTPNPAAAAPASQPPMIKPAAGASDTQKK